MSSSDERSTMIEHGFARLRANEWRGEVPELGSLSRGVVGPELWHRARRVGVACGVLLFLGGASYAGYRVVARSWEASIRAEGDRVEVMLNGQRVAPEAIEWLPDGTCLVTVNGARVLLDPRQPGGASAMIRVEESADSPDGE